MADLREGPVAVSRKQLLFSDSECRLVIKM